MPKQRAKASGAAHLARHGNGAARTSPPGVHAPSAFYKTPSSRNSATKVGGILSSTGSVKSAGASSASK